ncbi:hypothetical protein ACFQZJ_05055 [Maribacter chungangensis]|uniref:Uncharacterized protein n=1 Tax=Maribacter chungangensis TaxID=1069117 RepID=A0ABW3B0F8_9FLAO
MTGQVGLFILENAFILVYVLVLALSLIKYKYYYDTKLKALPILLAYILLTEIFGGLIRNIDEIQLIFEEDYQNYNHLIFNILDIVFFLYFFRIYSVSTTNLELKKYVKWGAVLFCLASAVNPFLNSFMLKPQLLAILIGSIAMITFSYMYLKETKKMRVTFSNYHKLLQSISKGLLIFYPFYPVILGIGQTNEALYYKFYLRELLFLLIIILYGYFIIGFVRLGNMKSNTETKKAF